MRRRDKKVVELFPAQRRGTALKEVLNRVGDRVGDVVSDLRKEMPPGESERLVHCLDDLDDVVIFLRALASA